MKLTTLETRRKRGDLIEFYKILNGFENVSWKNEFVKTHQDKENQNFFTKRNMPLWNDLPIEVKEARTV